MNQRGVKFRDVLVGSGELATGDVWVGVHTRMFLNRGEQLQDFWGDSEILRFRLKDRGTLAGLRYAVEGMRVGGKREVTIGPHLAYGEQGLPELIPPNAVLRGTFELVEVGQPGALVPLPEEMKRGCTLSIGADGEEEDPLPRWGLTIYDKDSFHHASQCFLSLAWNTRTDGKWSGRRSLQRTMELSLDVQEVEWMIEYAKELPLHCPGDCLHYDQVHTHGGYSPTRANADDVICWSVSVVENGEYRPICYLRENSPVWYESEWGAKVMALVQPHIVEAPWKQQE